MTPPLPACRAIVDILTRERPLTPAEEEAWEPLPDSEIAPLIGNRAIIAAGLLGALGMPWLPDVSRMPLFLGVDYGREEAPDAPDTPPNDGHRDDATHYAAQAIREVQGEREAKRRRRAQRAQVRGWDVFRALADAARKDWAEMQDAPEHNE